MCKRLLILLIIVCVAYAQSVILRGGTYRGVTVSPRESGGDLPPPPPPTDSIGAGFNVDDPIGGFIGYTEIIDYTTLSNNHTSSWIVSASGTPVDSLWAFLTSASNNDTIYIMDMVEIDITGTDGKLVNGTHLILCSGRGRIIDDTISNGALIYRHGAGGSSQYLRLNSTGQRVTGLRFEGSYYEPSNAMPSSFNQNVTGEYAIFAREDDSLEIDNCEFRGWGSAAISISNTRGSYVHHNHFHGGRHIYKGYQITVDNNYVQGDSTDVVIEANWFDHFRESSHIGGGSYTSATLCTLKYNIFGAHNDYYNLYQHSGAVDDSGASAVMYNNTFLKNTKGSWQGVDAKFPYAVRDSVIIYDNWCYRPDEASSWSVGTSKKRIETNQYGTTPPDGYASIMPVATIYSDVDSGTAPLAVKFCPNTCSDPDSIITHYRWWFGDSLKPENYDITVDSTDTVTYTFDTTGIYTVEMIAIDDDGNQDINYKTIKVKPTSGNFISFWIKDFYHGAGAYWENRLYIDSWLAWSGSTTGNQSWEHVIVDITDTLALKDSLTVTFRTICIRDSTVFGWFGTYIDNVHIFGADVVNDDFESGTWTGVGTRTDGYWIGGEYSPATLSYQAFENGGDVVGGNVGYCLTRTGAGAIKVGDYIQVYQKVDNPNVP